MAWFQVLCPYEGGGYGESVDVLVEGEDFEDAYHRIRKHSDEIPGFVEHSIQEKYCREKEELTVYDIKAEVEELGEPDVAIFSSGSLYRFKYVGVAEWVSDNGVEERDVRNEA